MSADGNLRLSDGNLHAEVWPANGGRIAGFYSLRGKERFDWMVPAPESTLGSGDAGSWGSFPLVPFSNRIRDARFVWEGTEHRIEATERGASNAIHGHGRSLAWMVEDATPRSTRMSYRYDAGDWPFAYRAEQRVVLEDGALQVEMRLVNESDRPMPAGLGHHPYFPWRGGPVLRSGFARYWPAVDGVLPAGSEPVPDRYDFADAKPLPRGLDTGFSEWDGGLSISWPGSGASLELCTDGGLDHVILFSPPGKDFFCAEPVSHAIDAINLGAKGVPGTGLRTLEAGGVMKVGIHFRPSE